MEMEMVPRPDVD